MSSKHSRETLEVFIGSAFLFAGWFTIFLIVLDILDIKNPDLLIIISIVCYAISLTGLALAVHGLVTMFATKRSRRKLVVR